MAVVDPQRMKTMAAILRDPYQVHWDRDATMAMGLDGRVINQGPLNLSYIANMLMAWQGERAFAVSPSASVVPSSTVITSPPTAP